jgi:hypothetical protein
MLTFLLWYLTISYLVGFALFAHEVMRMIEEDNYHLFGFGIVLLFLSPLTAWHGVLHYVAVLWHRFNGTPFKPFI